MRWSHTRRLPDVLSNLSKRVVVHHTGIVSKKDEIQVVFHKIAEIGEYLHPPSLALQAAVARFAMGSSKCH